MTQLVQKQSNRHRLVIFSLVAVLFVMLIQPTVALAGDDFSFNWGDFFFGFGDNTDSIGAAGVIGIIIAIIQLVLSIISLSESS